MKKTAIIILVFIISACNSQSKKKENVNHITKNAKMEKFDINIYKDWEIDESYEQTPYFKSFKKEDKRVEIEINEDAIQLREKSINSPYKIIKSFNNKKTLKYSGVNFYDAHIGSWKYYDDYGKIENEDDEDKYYKLSIEDITQLMKKEFDIDLLDVSERKSVDRDQGDTNTPPTYFISVPVKNTRSNRQITINANDGTLIKDQIVDPDAKFLKNKK